MWVSALLAGLLVVDARAAGPLGPRGAGAQPVDLDFETDTFCDDPGAELSINGDARPGDPPGPCPLVLTANEADAVGTAFTRSAVPIGPLTVVRATFALEIGGGGVDHASGMTFAAHPRQASLVGGAGEQLGYGTIAPSIAVEFDTYPSGAFDPAVPHVGIDRDGDVEGTWVVPPVALVEAPLYVWVEFHQQDAAIRVWLADTPVRPALPALDEPADLLDLGEEVRFGFTAASGSGVNRDQHLVTSWRLEADDDTDGDGVMDFEDRCAGDDATGDDDGDGVCNDRDPCDQDVGDDSDGDGVCDGEDRCPGRDDTVDVDRDGVPDCLAVDGPGTTPTGERDGGRDGVRIDPYPAIGGCGCGGGAPVGGAGALVALGAALVRRRRAAAVGGVGLVGLGCAGFGPSVDAGPHLAAVCAAADAAGPALGPGAWVALDRPPATLPDGVHVTLRAEGATEVDGSEGDLVAALHERAELQRTLAERLGAPPSTTAVLSVEAEVPVERVVAALGAVHGEGLTWAVFTATTEAPLAVPVPPPPDPALADALRAELGALAPADRATAVAERVSDQVSWCPGLVETFSAVAAVDPDSKCEIVAAGVAEALPGCPWVRADALLTTLHVTMLPDPSAVTSVGVGLDPASAAPLTVPAGAPWRDVLPRWAALDPAPGWLAVE